MAFKATLRIVFHANLSDGAHFEVKFADGTYTVGFADKAFEILATRRIARNELAIETDGQIASRFSADHLWRMAEVLRRVDAMPADASVGGNVPKAA